MKPCDRIRDLRTGDVLRFVRWTMKPNMGRVAVCFKPGVAGQSRRRWVPADKLRKIKWKAERKMVTR